MESMSKYRAADSVFVDCWIWMARMQQFTDYNSMAVIVISFPKRWLMVIEGAILTVIKKTWWKVINSTEVL